MRRFVCPPSIFQWCLSGFGKAQVTGIWWISAFKTSETQLKATCLQTAAGFSRRRCIFWGFLHLLHWGFKTQKGTLWTEFSRHRFHVQLCVVLFVPPSSGRPPHPGLSLSCVLVCRVELSRRGFPRNGWKQFEPKNTYQGKFVCFHDFFPTTLAHQILFSPRDARWVAVRSGRLYCCAIISCNHRSGGLNFEDDASASLLGQARRR